MCAFFINIQTWYCRLKDQTNLCFMFHHSSLFQGCRGGPANHFLTLRGHWINEVFIRQPRVATVRRVLRGKPFEITLLMKRGKLQALTWDFMSTSEQGGPPLGCSDTQTHTALHVHNLMTYTKGCNNSTTRALLNCMSHVNVGRSDNIIVYAQIYREINLKLHALSCVGCFLTLGVILIEISTSKTKGRLGPLHPFWEWADEFGRKPQTSCPLVNPLFLPVYS